LEEEDQLKKIAVIQIFIVLAKFPFCFPALGPLTVENGYKMVQSGFKKLAC